MKIIVLEEMESHFNEIRIRLKQIKDLSCVLQDYIKENEKLKPCDIENLTSALNQKITEVKEKFNSICNESNF